MQHQTSSLKQRLEKLRFFQDLDGRILGSQSLFSLLRCLSILHAQLENALNSTAENSPTRRVWHPQEARLPFLLQNLKALVRGQEHGSADILPAIERALLLADRFLLDQEARPTALLGALLVLEELQAVCSDWKSRLERHFSLNPEDLSYFSQPRALRERLERESVAWTQSERQALFSGIQTTMDGLEAVFSALQPYREDQLAVHVTSVNPEAGRQPMPVDPGEIAAAIRAGRRAWREFPYLELRYGDRGRRYTTSDSTWLATLYPLETAQITKNLTWLRTLLAPRGITSIILEFHLNALLNELQNTAPGNPARFARLEESLRELQAQRLHLLPEIRWNRWQAEFETRFQACPGPRVPSAARLLLSAWWDETTGITGSMDGMRNWFCDPARFSTEWITVTDEMSGALRRDSRY